MSDLRDQLRKAGLVSEKQLRQAKHQERVHAKEVGHAGIEAERRAEEERLRAEEEARRRADRERDENRKQRERDATRHERAAQIVRGGWIREAALGARRFYFVASSGRITYLDLSETVIQRLLAGTAAIVDTGRAVRGEFCVIAERAAAELAQIEPGRIRFWARGRHGEADA